MLAMDLCCCFAGQSWTEGNRGTKVQPGRYRITMGTDTVRHTYHGYSSTGASPCVVNPLCRFYPHVERWLDYLPGEDLCCVHGMK